ncbi:plasmodesmata-located protein 7-like [Typha latifolia]|uniref:plasmodesmata-located protein 7-like n=1 Tax=Typha latifolia TaxID=4733 RepID=UPI003C30B311
MTSFHLLFTLLLVPLLSSTSRVILVIGADDYNGFVYAGCSQPRYDAGSAYEYSVDSVLTSLTNAADFTSYANFSSPSPPLVSGLLQCRSDLPLSACDSCVRSALSQLSTLCPFAAGAAVQLRACFIRYGNDSFLGKPDNTLLYKKCSADQGSGGGGGPDGSVSFIGMRDAAVGSLVGGAYRVGGAGYVQAMSQCVGDLSAKACSDCVSTAAGQLKAACSSSASGEVYLGKCYARYWSYNGGYSPSHVGHGDQAGKTLAIIIGLMAGVALIIVFLSFIRRAGNGK